MTLQYGLAMAPASQPRNALYGQTLAVTIALAYSYIPESAMPLWVRVPLATATAIACMTRLGITHPPAGAAALILSGSTQYDWMILPLMLLGNVLAIIMATFINNLSEKRQYPTYLKFGGALAFASHYICFWTQFWYQLLCCCFCGASSGEEEQSENVETEGSQTSPPEEQPPIDDKVDGIDGTSNSIDIDSLPRGGDTPDP